MLWEYVLSFFQDLKRIQTRDPTKIPTAATINPITKNCVKFSSMNFLLNLDLKKSVMKKN